MSAALISLAIAALGLVLSLAGAFFISGWRWGSMSKDVEYIKRDVAEIKSLFRLTFVKPDEWKK